MQGGVRETNEEEKPAKPKPDKEERWPGAAVEEPFESVGQADEGRREGLEAGERDAELERVCVVGARGGTVCVCVVAVSVCEGVVNVVSELGVCASMVCVCV